MPKYTSRPGEVPRDWRGVRIEVGATVIYGASVNRSVALVEAVVDGFSESGRVRLRIVRRAYGSWGTDRKPMVTVGRDRLTVVKELERSTVPTEDEDVVQKLEERVQYWEKELRKLRDGEKPYASHVNDEYVTEQISKARAELDEKRRRLTIT